MIAYGPEMPEPWRPMERIRRLRNPIREYAWGSRTALAELLGEPVPAPRPQAELWMGAHPVAPSEVQHDSGWMPLGDWIRNDPTEVLGAAVVGEFGDELPFLLKLITAEQPLSLQAHPDAAQARSGFERENRAGIPIAAPQRSYRDPNPKPELLCALTPFAALCGFRDPAEIVEQVDALRAHRLTALLGGLRSRPDRGSLAEFFRAWMELAAVEREAVLDDVQAAVEAGEGDPRVKGWIRKLAAAHPGDPGVLAPLFLNALELRPGEALYLGAGELHAYLHGAGVEIMANSDNVLRGGLTAKHVDVPELLAALSFATGPPEIRTPRPCGPIASVYGTPASEFELAVLRLSAGVPLEVAASHAVEILLCTQGRAELEHKASGDVTPLSRGAAALATAAAGSYRIRGEAVIYRASVPSDSPQRAQ